MRRFIKRFLSMEKARTLESKAEVYDYLKTLNIDYKIYEHAQAKTVQDIIGKNNQIPSASSTRLPSSKTSFTRTRRRRKTFSSLQTTTPQ